VSFFSELFVKIRINPRNPRLKALK